MNKCGQCELDATYAHGIITDEVEYSCDEHKCAHCYKIEIKEYIHNEECDCPCNTRGFFRGLKRGRMAGKKQGAESLTKFLYALYDSYLCEEHKDFGCFECEEK